MKVVVGLILIIFTLSVRIANEWIARFYWVGAATMLKVPGSVTIPKGYNPSREAHISLSNQIFLWFFMALGMILLFWGIIEDENKKKSK
ncbi:MAG: hypothetical protein DRP50_06405 [Thermotoga sp.]|nr:MAG: hypothetical protein DRP50_06405 [Thermotoga sp.]